MYTEILDNSQSAIYNLHYTLYFAGSNKIVKVRKSSIIKEFLTTFHKQGQKLLGFLGSSGYFSGYFN